MIIFIFFNQRPVLIEQQSILGFLVFVLHVLCNSCGPVDLVVIFEWRGKYNNTADQSLTPVSSRDNSVSCDLSSLKSSWRQQRSTVFSV